MSLLTNRAVVLASASPRRLMLLRQIGIEPRVIAAEIQEIGPRPGMPAGKLVMKNANLKALAVSKCIPKQDEWIIAADTVVALDNQLLGKPKGPEEARRMLRALSGRWHQVFSGLCLLDAQSGRRLSGYSTTKVHFSSLTDQEIAAYIATGEPRDKAGAYGMQGQASLFVDRIEGDYTTVVGLSLPLLRMMFRKLEEKKDLPYDKNEPHD